MRAAPLVLLLALLAALAAPLAVFHTHTGGSVDANATVYAYAARGPVDLALEPGAAWKVCRGFQNELEAAAGDVPWPRDTLWLGPLIVKASVEPGTTERRLVRLEAPPGPGEAWAQAMMVFEIRAGGGTYYVGLRNAWSGYPCISLEPAPGAGEVRVRVAALVPYRRADTLVPEGSAYLGLPPGPANVTVAVVGAEGLPLVRLSPGCPGGQPRGASVEPWPPHGRGPPGPSTADAVVVVLVRADGPGGLPVMAVGYKVVVANGGEAEACVSVPSPPPEAERLVVTATVWGHAELPAPWAG